MDDSELTTLIESLRWSGGDTTSVEVKSAAGGFPTTLKESLSGLANKPGGGLVLLGIDENRGFKPVGLTKTQAQALKQGLGSAARAFEPPIRLTITDAIYEGERVVAAQVHECATSSRPCRVKSSGKAFVRSFDGDYEMSAVEEQGFLSQREHPRCDEQAVSGSDIDDLDASLVDDWMRNIRARDPKGLGKFDDDDTLLRMAGILLESNEVSKAAILTLGKFPQKWFPRLVIQAVASRGSGAKVPLEHRRSISGPIPTMMEEAIAWARTVFTPTITRGGRGSVTDEPEYPLEAFRELISNALIHRDLDEWSEGQSVEVRLTTSQLIVNSPGGLYGTTVSALGKKKFTTARNARLLTLCQDVRTPAEGNRVVEALATGIPIIREALAEHEMPPPHFIDTGIAFTAVLRAPSPAGRLDGATSTRERLYELLADAPQTVKQLEAMVDVGSPAIRKALRLLIADGLVRSEGGRGKPTIYRRAL